MKKGVHIIECLDTDDPGSEGRCLKHLFDLLQIKAKYQHITTIDELLDAMSASEYEYIHISAHGAMSEEDRFAGWWTHKGHGRKSKMASLKSQLKCIAVISTACKSGSDKFVKYVVNELGSKYFIGPKENTSFPSAIFFSHILYHKLFITKHSLPKAFASYNAGYKNPFKFSLFQRNAT